MQDDLQKLMLVTNSLDPAPAGGRELLCKVNHDALKCIYGTSLVVVELSRKKLQGLGAGLNAFKGDIDGLNNAVISAALQTIEEENVTKIFVDGSNLGAFVKRAKQKFPDVEISTFFHNVEARFFLGALRQSPSWRSVAVLLANYLAERKAVRNSDKIICLSNRDSRLLEKYYGRAATHTSPMALEDRLPAHCDTPRIQPCEDFALFVGGGFYANRAGISWFVKYVVPHIQIKICVVGRGFDDIKHELEREGKVEVVGGVDSLAEWYRQARFVIAPIFDGSGMKTKVAEALMYGKRIVGTAEAFSGYEEIATQAGWICQTSRDFANSISEAQSIITESFDPILREIYLQNYSFHAARQRFVNILK